MVPCHWHGFEDPMLVEKEVPDGGTDGRNDLAHDVRGSRRSDDIHNHVRGQNIEDNQRAILQEADVGSLVRLKGELALDKEVEHQACKEGNGRCYPQIDPANFMQEGQQAKVDCKRGDTNDKEFDEMAVANSILETADQAYGTIPHDSKLPPVLVGLSRTVLAR